MATGSGAFEGRPGAVATIAATAVAMVAFAANSVLCRAALAGDHVDPSTFTALRLLSGAVVLGCLARVRSSTERDVSSSSWRSAVALFVYALGFSLAYVRVAAAVGALLLFASVQLTMIGVGLLSGERPRAREWTGLVVSIAGLGVLTSPGLERPDLLGAVLMVLAGGAWGVYSLLGRGEGAPLERNAAHFARSAPLAGLIAVLALSLGRVHAEPLGVGLALVSGAAASGLGYVVWFAALRGLSATRAATVQLSVPPLAALGGVLFLGEALSSRLVVATVLILGGIALAMRPPDRVSPSALQTSDPGERSESGPPDAPAALRKA